MDETWFLECIAADGSLQRHSIRSLPFGVGRDAVNDLPLDVPGLSRRHAVFELDAAGRLCLADQGSTNGTFVNRERIEAARLLADGDVVHFGHAEFRLGCAEEPTPTARQSLDPGRTVLVPKDKALSRHFVRLERPFMELLAGQGLSAAVQPIVDARSGALVAYELLGRSAHPELPQAPGALFHLAATLGREAELSAAFRRHGVPAVASRLGAAQLFVNAHPSETFTEAFFETLAGWRRGPDAPRLVVEIHEQAVVDLGRMRELVARLADIGVPFAYDDFGAGQARLLELAEVPADFVKFDMGLVRGLHEAPAGRLHMVRELVRLVRDLGSVALAEGVESEAEAAACRELGFQLLQGYLTGRPVALDAL